MTPPPTFISYSWDNEIHKEWVRSLAGRLRKDGVNVTLDRWHTAPGDQLPAFMERAIRDNRFIVIICIPRYKSRSDERLGGVGYEGDIMTAEVMIKQNNRKFIPVLRSRVTTVPLEVLCTLFPSPFLASHLYTIPFALSRQPPAEWESLFIASWNHPPQWTSMHRPGIASINNATVILAGTTIDEIKKYHRETLLLATARVQRR